MTSITLKHRKRKPGEELWLLTYADCITLLLTFFILMLSMSTPNQSKMEQMQEGLSKELYKKPVELPFTEIRDELKSIVSTKGLDDMAMITADSEGVKVQFASNLLYQVGSAEIEPDMLPVLGEVAGAITHMTYDYVVEVEGHTDDVPIKTAQYPSNWELSASRAINVVQLFIEKGVPTDRIQAIGFADSRPLAPNRDDAGIANAKNQSMNRRIIVNIYRRK